MKKLISKLALFIMTIVMLFTMIPGTLIALAADDIINIRVSGTENYDYAFEVLERLNVLRSSLGLPEVVMNKTYLEKAMTRSAEISLYFSHTRPGESGQYTENIASGSDTPEDVMKLWINSEGHYKNLTNQYITSVGVGCFQDNQGNYWWTLIFTGYIVEPYFKSGAYEATYNISAKKECLNINTWNINSYCIDTKQSCCIYNFDTLPDKGYLNVQSTSTYMIVDPLNFVFSSSNESVIQIVENGEYVIGNSGVATLKATLKEDPTVYFEKEITVLPKDLSSFFVDFSLDNYSFICDGTPKMPKVLNTKGLTEGVDYTVAYSNNINAAVGNDRGKVTVTGIGNYTGSLKLRFFIQDEICDHNYVEVRTEPTCKKLGSVKMICSKCGETDNTAAIKYLPKVSHNYIAEVTNSDCENPGKKVYTCSMCGDSYSDIIPAAGHKYSSDWTLDIQPTCKSEGSKSHHCTVCGAKKDVTVIPKTEHSYTVTEKKPTCVSGGSKTYTCKDCGKTYTESVSATGHSYTGKITKAAACTATGLKTYTCSACGDSYTEIIPATGHKYSSEWTVDKKATCTTEGSKSHHCTLCGVKKDITVIPMTNHNYITTVIKAATCTEKGENKITCSDCGECHTENVLAKGHNYAFNVVNPSYTAQGYTTHTCTVCGNSYKDNYTDKLVLGNVSGFKISSTNVNAIKLTWNKVSGADGYVVYRYNTSTKKYGRIAKIGDLSFTDKNLKSGTSYKYAIRAFKAVNGKEVLSPTYPQITATTNPANISKVSFKSSANVVKMSWDKVSGATGYRVYKYNTSTKKWQTVANTKNTSYTFSKLKAGTTYKYTVRAYKTLDGKTYLSPKYSSFTSSTNPATVSFKLTAGSKKATVKWSKVTGATGYKVYYKTSKNGKWIGLKTTNNKTTSYTKTGLKKGKTYYFTVKAYRSVGGKTYNGSFVTKGVKVK